jgi:hypothetical protein
MSEKIDMHEPHDYTCVICLKYIDVKAEDRVYAKDEYCTCAEEYHAAVLRRRETKGDK